MFHTVGQNLAEWKSLIAEIVGQNPTEQCGVLKTISLGLRPLSSSGADRRGVSEAKAGCWGVGSCWHESQPPNLCVTSAVLVQTQPK